MTKTWDGIERRQAGNELHGRRDPDDRHCGEHFAIQEHTKEHRTIVCGKLSELKALHKENLLKLEAELQRKADSDEVDRVEVIALAKADHKDLTNALRLIKFMVGIAVLVIAGQALWLKSDSSKLDAKIDSGFMAIHRRITETQSKVEANMVERVKSDTEQTKALTDISGQLSTFNWRMTQIESTHKK